MKNENGITLIALIITIILMLILAGVVLNLTIGENGLFKITKQAGEDYKIAGIKEKVEQEILVLQAGKIEKDEKLTVEQALIGLEKNKTFSEIDLIEQTGIVDGYIIKLGYDMWENVIIEGINKDGEIRIVTKIEPKGYTKEKVTIAISLKGSNAKVTNIDVPEEMIKKEDGTYEITKNGTYLVKVILDNEETIEKEIKIDVIDKFPPKAFEITAEDTGDGIAIKGETQDTEANNENACSGIDRYEYVVTDETGKETTYNSNEITGLEAGTYTVYARCYDKAGNPTKSDTIDVECKNWIKIYNEEGLKNIANNMSANYILMKDIELTEEWEAIGKVGDSSNQFRGTLNGNRHKITGLNITATKRLPRTIWVYTKRRKSK